MEELELGGEDDAEDVAGAPLPEEPTKRRKARAEGFGQKAKRGKGSGYQELADKYLRRAMRAAGDGEPSPQADFLLRAANVYATLELASAFRSQSKSG
jgi:hypothetical protein